MSRGESPMDALVVVLRGACFLAVIAGLLYVGLWLDAEYTRWVVWG